MVRLCPYCNRPMLHKFLMGVHNLYIHDHDSPSGAEKFKSPMSIFECPECEIFLIHRNESPATYLKKEKCLSCGTEQYYTNKDWDSDSFVVCKSCLSEFFLEAD